MLSSACSTYSPHSAQPGPQARQQLLQGDIFGVAPDDRLPPSGLLDLDDEMHRFLEEQVPGYLSREKKIRYILQSLLQDGLDLQYHNFHTYTAQETFHSRRGNCMSFTNLFVALAREAGLNVSYQEVEVPASWGALSGSWLYSKHINAVVDLPGQDRMVDFNLREFREGYPRYRLSDQAAEARYHNNLGVHWMLEEEPARAFMHFRRALELQPDTSFFWTNLGSLYRRVQYPELAVQAFLVAIDIDGEPAATSNLARYYRKQGELENARYYEAQVAAFRRKNPFYLYHVATQAYAEADYEQAEQLLRRALRLYDDDHRFHQLLGLTYTQQGRADKARQRFRSAAELAVNADDRALYQRKLELLAGG